MSNESYVPAQRLKAATAIDHLATEKLLGLSQGENKEFTRLAFQRLVCTNHQIWSAFQLKMKAQTPGWWAGYEPLVTTIADAAALDFSRHSPSKSYRGPEYPVIPNPHVLAGSLYVHLGSLLGGRFIHSALHKNEGLVACRPFRFYAAGAGFTGGDWRIFVGKLNAALSNQEELEVAVRQARAVFRHYQAVYATFDKVG